MGRIVPGVISPCREVNVVILNLAIIRISIGLEQIDGIVDRMIDVKVIGSDPAAASHHSRSS